MPFRWRSMRSLVVSFLVRPGPAYAGGPSCLGAGGSARTRRASPGLELSRPSEHSTDEGEELVARVTARGVPRVQVHDPARLADPLAPKGRVELEAEAVAAREHRLVRRGRGGLSRILHGRLHVQRGGGPCYGRKLRTLSVGSQGGRLRFPRVTVCSGLVSVRTGTRPP